MRHLQQTRVNGYLWRPVLAKLDTLSAVRAHWTLDDLCDAHAILDYQEAIERETMRRAQAKAGG